MRDAVQEIRGAIQRVDHPLIVVLPRLFAAFLGQNAVVGVGLAQRLDDVSLGLHIRFADKIATLLGGDVEPFEMVEMAEQNTAGAERGALGDVQNGIHGGSDRLKREPGYPARARHDSRLSSARARTGRAVGGSARSGLPSAPAWPSGLLARDITNRGRAVRSSRKAPTHPILLLCLADGNN